MASHATPGPGTTTRTPSGSATGRRTTVRCTPLRCWRARNRAATRSRRPIREAPSVPPRPSRIRPRRPGGPRRAGGGAPPRSGGGVSAVGFRLTSFRDMLVQAHWPSASDGAMGTLMAKIIVLGAGVCGLATAMLLARDPHDVTVLERDPDPLAEAAGEAWA